MTNNSQTKNQKGFSLLELLLVVAVGAVLILAGLAAYRLVTENNNVNESVRLINTLKQQTQRAYQSEGDYGAGDLVPVLTTLRAFPAGVLNAAGIPQHPYGGDILIVGANNTFTIVFEDIDEAACIQIGQSFDAAVDSDFVQLAVAEGLADGTGAALADTSIVTLDGACGADVEMAWTFY